MGTYVKDVAAVKIGPSGEITTLRTAQPGLADKWGVIPAFQSYSLFGYLFGVRHEFTIGKLSTVDWETSSTLGEKVFSEGTLFNGGTHGVSRQDLEKIDREAILISKDGTVMETLGAVEDEIGYNLNELLKFLGSDADMLLFVID